MAEQTSLIVEPLLQEIASLRDQLRIQSLELTNTQSRLHSLQSRQVEYEDQYQVMFENSHSIKLLIDPDTGIIVDANQTACRFYGYPKEILQGMQVSSLNTMSEAEIAEEMQIALTQRHFFNFHHRLSNGEIRDVEVFTGPILMQGRTLLHSLIQDVTERRAQERELRLLWHAVNQSANSVVITDINGDIEYVNPYFTKLTGYSLDEVRGQNPRILKSGHTSPKQYDEMWRLLSAGQRWMGEFSNKKKNGDFYWEQASIAPILNEIGEVTHFVAIKEDITQRKAIEHALQESENRFRTLVNSMDDVVFTLDRQGRHDGLYGHWLEKRNVPADVFLGKTAIEILGSEAGAVHEAANCQALDGQTVVYEWSAGIQTIQTSLSPIHDKQGNVIGIVGIGRDISPLKAIERQLREAERFAHSTVDALSAQIAILDQNGVIVAVNTAWNRFAKQHNADLIKVGVGVNYLDVLAAVDPSDEDSPVAQAVLAGIQQIAQGISSEFSLEYQCRLPGEQRWYVLRATSFNVDNASHVVVAYEDITERVMAQQVLDADSKRLERLVQERTAQLRRVNVHMNTILDNVSNPILFVDADGKIGMTNTAFQRKLGYRPADLQHETLWLIFAEGSRLEAVHKWRAVHAGSRRERLEAQLITKDGLIFDAEVSFTSVPNNEDHVVCTLYDISHLKEVNRVKDQFISMVSHELRTPLASVLMNTDTIRRYYDRLSDEQKQRKLEQVSEQGQQILDLVNSILDLSRLSTRQGQRGSHPIDIGQTLLDVAAALTQQANAKQQQIQVDIGCCETSIQGEQADMASVWQNLLTNAIKYTGVQGQIRASLYDTRQPGQLPALSEFADQLPPDFSSGCYLVGVVEDNGHGIHSEDIPHVFTRFYRGWAAGTTIPGTGLGLAIVRDVLQLYGGDIAVISQVGTGTTFCFWLPITELEGET